MCRFLIIRNKVKTESNRLLTDFANACRRSLTPEGDQQGDGWGVAWLKEGNWQIKKSLRPIWEETEVLAHITAAEMFVIHARSAGFPSQKGILAYNQPYLEKNLCFVFNGMARGVKLPYQLEGIIGAQKIFSLLKRKMLAMKPVEALWEIRSELISHADKIESLNIGLIVDKSIYALNEYPGENDYFQLYSFKNEFHTVIGSMPFGSFPWEKLSRSELNTWY
ncbi:MAG: hypothetical protein UV73_C0001G0265 [Candidatus Gottesmanbacteria bacterium GW2011_GWA2_43_14]|uniref:Glutamine amidotransferase type-2 domain-containing protein n=1 Tax=Candidatus Gottesmanbacteria bacterium GW2011_GWA2_43_14 TaxID=1618443 RepID=A0A0G1DM85_9BACT|nr:MAG: hypothetical protein UV73_C0001G0265 [Candidatus Gottesmanbacteria bacterium GW2011_GWA2_43_14]